MIILSNISRDRPCKCGHTGKRHWHNWTETMRTVGDFQCHFILGCDCWGYVEMENLEYIAWKYMSQRWFNRLFQWLL